MVFQIVMVNNLFGCNPISCMRTLDLLAFDLLSVSNSDAKSPLQLSIVLAAVKMTVNGWRPKIADVPESLRELR